LLFEAGDPSVTIASLLQLFACHRLEEVLVKPIVSNPERIAHCGLYCGACRAYLKDRCPGCHENAKAKWCTVRSCCIERSYASCAECVDFSNPKDCRLYNNFISRLFGVVMRSDRAACIRQIKEQGLAGHAEAMTRLKRPSMRR
jgi:hypothetical protein